MVIFGVHNVSQMPMFFHKLFELLIVLVLHFSSSYVHYVNTMLYTCNSSFSFTILQVVGKQSHYFYAMILYTYSCFENAIMLKSRIQSVHANNSYTPYHYIILTFYDVLSFYSYEIIPILIT